MRKSIVVASLILAISSQAYASSQELHKTLLKDGYSTFYNSHIQKTIKQNKAQIVQENSIDNEELTGFEDELADTQEIFDPLSGYNEVMTDFNDSFYINVVMPVSQTYANVVHENIRTSISNVYDNLMFPIRFANNLLQLKFTNAAEELGRFVLNSTLGLLGIFDIGDKAGLQEHDEDFGQTLGYYGVGTGFHIVIPFYGPSNLRDILGFAVDSYVDPMTTTVAYEPYQIPDNAWEEVGYKTFNLFNENSFRPDAYLELKKDAVELYPFLRAVYEQRREQLIKE